MPDFKPFLLAVAPTLVGLAFFVGFVQFVAFVARRWKNT